MEVHEFDIELRLFAFGTEHEHVRSPRKCYFVIQLERKARNLFPIFSSSIEKHKIYIWKKESVNRSTYKYIGFMLMHANNRDSNEFQMNKKEKVLEALKMENRKCVSWLRKNLETRKNRFLGGSSWQCKRPFSNNLKANCQPCLRQTMY